jgi:tetratricopeptide (TPR) repeat protein
MKVVDGKYQILEKLGEGFGGSVFLVESNGKKVALKQLRMRTDHAYLSPQEILDNFKEEFTILKKLNHPHILRILDFGFDAKENFYYFTNEYIHGEDIFLATRDLSPEEIEELFVQVLRALSYLHRHRVYHLDIKPSNILVEKKGNSRVAKLIDFGLASFRKEGILAGTPAYLAPESLIERPKDGRADLYSLGVTWYSCLAGKNPFDSDDMKQTVALHRVWMPPPISEKVSNAPSYLDSILEKLLKKNPTERYHRADQVIRDLNWGGRRNYPLETEATALSYLPGEGELVGREEEWSKLLSYFERVFTTRSDIKFGVAISGPPGTGKSRLLKELKYHAQLHTIPVLEGREILQTKVTQDCMILLDDVDETLFSSIEQWMLLFHNYSVLMVLTGFSPKTTSGLWHTISLKNFDPQKVSQYISSVLGVPDPPNFLVEELYQRTEGNPLFLTELLQSLIQSRQLFDEQGQWSPMRLQDIGIDFRKLKVPKTLTEYLQNKYNRLPLGASQILLAISLSKASLTRHDVTRLGFGQNPTDWKILEEEGLIATDLSGNFHLINPNFQDWVPPNVDLATIAILHQSLGKLFCDDPERKETALYHLGLGTGSPTERFEFLLQYGEALLRHDRWLGAAGAFESALSLAQTPEKQIDAKLKKVRALFRAGKRSEALSLLEESQAILKNEKEKAQHWHWVQQTWREMASLYLKEGRLDLARESLQASRVLLEEHSEDSVEEMILDNFKASLLMREGKLKEAQTMSEGTYRRWQLLPEEQKRQVLNNELASIYLAEGKKEEAKRFFQEQAFYCEKIGNRSKRSYALYGWAESCFALKQFGEATKVFKECVEICRETKSEELLFCAFNGLGNIAYLQEDWENAARYYENALDLAQHCTNVEGSFAVAMNIALVRHLQGDIERANIIIRHVIHTLEMLTSPSLHQLQFLVRTYLEFGKIHLENANGMGARDAYRDAIRLVRKYSSLENFRFSALLGLYQADSFLGQKQEAQSVLTELEKENLSSQEKKELERIKKLQEGPKKLELVQNLS